MGEGSSGEVPVRRSEDYDLSGSAGNNPPNDGRHSAVLQGRDHRNEQCTQDDSNEQCTQDDWAAFCLLQGRVQRDGVGQLKGTQVGKAFCDKLDELVREGEFSSGKAEYLKNHYSSARPFPCVEAE